MEKDKYYCLYCGVELDFKPTDDGGFCSTECEDSYFETNGIEKDEAIDNQGDTCDDWESDDLTEEELEAQRVDAAERENHRKAVEGEIV